MNPIYDLPPWQFGGLTIVVFVAVALGGLVATRAWFRGRGLHALVDNGVIGWIFSAILVIYAIAIGLTAVQTWGNEERAAGEASDEASRIAALYRDLSGYPDPRARNCARCSGTTPDSSSRRNGPCSGVERSRKAATPCWRASSGCCSPSRPRPMSNASCTPKRCGPTTSSSRNVASGWRPSSTPS